MTTKHPLMHNNFTRSDFSEVKKLFNKKNPILTQSKKVKEFEKKWSKWLGVKYSTFVNSGSSANYISISLLKIINKDKNKNEIIVPSLTWISDISSVILNGFKVKTLATAGSVLSGLAFSKPCASAECAFGCICGCFFSNSDV